MLQAREYVASTVLAADACFHVASLAVHLISVAAPVAACFVYYPASLPAFSFSLADGILVPCGAPAFSCAFSCSPLASDVDLKLMQ